MKLDTTFVYSLVVSILLVSAPHAEYLPLWVSLISSMLLGWRIYLNYNSRALPSRWLLLAITVACVAGILISFKTLFGREAGVALLISLSALKLLELRNMRDATVLIYLSSFIIITNFFNSQSIATALYMLLTLLVIMSTWLQMHSGALSFMPRLRMAAALLLQAIPLTLLLFVLFPRVQGPLWGMPQDAHARSGLSDSMSPGTMGKLSLSQEVAFRINFETAPPPQQLMYWRGPVLWDYDGTTWKSGNEPSANSRVSTRKKAPQLDHIANPLAYTVTLEPHNKNWLFALEMPAKVSIVSVLTDDFQLHSLTPVNVRIRYSVQSQLAYRANADESPVQLKRALQLPPALNPRTRQLAAEWRARLNNDDAIIRAAISHFNREGFSYTLEPPLLGRHGMDEFLFTTRQGYCEHYASSFVFLMRAAGIPARVVTGYQGGERNELGGYTIVRQSDAHAWAEVWLAARGWIRIDPTAAISPERIQNGLRAALPDSPLLPLMARIQMPILLKMRFQLDTLNHRWNQWVLGYNNERQFAFLTRLGMEDISWQSMAIKLLIGMAILVGLFTLILLRKLYARQTDSAQAQYLKFCKKLARAGIERADHEGPLDFAARAALSKPQLAAAINAITARYLALRYENQCDTESFRALRRDVAAFKL